METSPSYEHPPYEAFLHRLAGKPMLVTGVTFLLATAITIFLLIIEPTDVDILGVISLAATIWGLTLALVIYLLTAQDNDRVMEQIADLKEQLAASLLEPEEVESKTVDETTTDNDQVEPQAASAATTNTSSKPTSQRHRVERQTAAGRPQRTPNSQTLRAERESMVYRADDGVPLTDRVPVDYVNAWQTATGREADQIIRGWTRGHTGQSPWVLLAADGSRWSVFASGDGSPSVISLDEPRPARAARRWQR